MRAIVVFSLSLALAAPVAWAQRERPVPIRTPFIAEPLTEAEMATRVVAEGEPFLVQRLRALASATLTSGVSVRGRAGAATFESGTQLVAARAVGDNRGYFCGAYDPEGGFSAWLNGVFRVEWVCFLDTDNDRVFDRVFMTPRNYGGAVLPTFDQLSSPSETRAPFEFDASDRRVTFDHAIFYYHGTGILGSSYTFAEKVRAPGSTEWVDLFSRSRGVVAGGVALLRPNDVLGEVDLTGAQFQVLAITEAGLEIQPRSGLPTNFSLGIR